MSEQNILQVGLCSAAYFLANKTVLKPVIRHFPLAVIKPQKIISSYSHFAKLDLIQESATSSNSCSLKHRNFLKQPVDILWRDRQGRKMNMPQQQQPRNSNIFDSGLCWAHFSCSQEDSLHSLLK